ncbi:MAG: TRAP transporter substrate-binding protein DctP [Deltaproteobacteria bacterium]|nr:TRAP transporter substrate-binding protein DctP [Deltaproteobacteria bacterium]
MRLWIADCGLRSNRSLGLRIADRGSRNFNQKSGEALSLTSPLPLPASFLSFLILLLVPLFILSFLNPDIASAEKVILKIGTLAPEGSTWVKAFRDINRELGEKTKGQVAIRIFPGGVLGDEEDMLRKIKVGQIQGGFFSGGGLGIIFKDIKILVIPSLFENYKEVDAVMAKMSGHFEKGIEDNGFKIMGWAESGFIYLFSKHPIKGAADLRKGKVWIWEDTAIGRAVFKELGINGIPLGIPDVLVSLQTGMIDTVYASPGAAISMQWFTRVSYMTDVPLSYSVGAAVLHKSAFEKIPQALRGTVEEIFRRHLALLKEKVRQEDQKAISVLTRQGIKLISPNQKEVKEMQALSLKGVDTLGEDIFSKKTLAEVKAFLKNLRKEN